MTAPSTPGQTVGPFFHDALPYAGGPDLVPPAHPDAIRFGGRVLDGDGAPVPDALLELWQVAPDGTVPQVAGSLRRDGATFTGWGRAATDAQGRYSFSTLRPDAPFVSLTVFARGLLHRLFTRAYLPGHQDDPFLAQVPADRRETLLAHPDGAAGVDLRFDVRLQGDGETVFLSFGDE